MLNFTNLMKVAPYVFPNGGFVSILVFPMVSVGAQPSTLGPVFREMEGILVDW